MEFKSLIDAKKYCESIGLKSSNGDSINYIDLAQWLSENNHDKIILDSLPHWAMLIDTTTRTILAANKLAQELGSTIHGQCWDDFGHREAISDENKNLITIDPNRKRDNCIKCTFCEADEAISDKKNKVSDVEIGEQTWRTHWVPVYGSIVLHYAIDVTEEKKIEQLKLKHVELETAVQTAGTVCHELSQPLQIIMSGIELLKIDMQEGKIPDTENSLRMEEQCARMGVIINKILSLTEVKKKKYLSSEIIDID